MSPYDWSLVIVGMLLQGMVLATMLKGPFRRYPLIFAYLIFCLLSTVAQFSFKHYFGPRSKEFIRAYWTCDFVGTLLVLIIIINLIRTAMEGHKYRSPVYWGLLSGVVSMAVVSSILMRSFSGFGFGKWMTEVGRNYYFAAVLLNAMLWSTLMRSNSENKQLYLLTSGLGLKLTGAAVAHALRVTNTMVFVASQFVIPVAYLLHLYIWYVALKKFPVVLPADLKKTAYPEAAR